MPTLPLGEKLERLYHKEILTCFRDVREKLGGQQLVREMCNLEWVGYAAKGGEEFLSRARRDMLL